jgi:hypothetical protein
VRHRGRIHADAVPGAGANFHVELLDLPLPGDDTPGHEDRRHARMSAKMAEILLVEDNRDDAN